MPNIKAAAFAGLGFGVFFILAAFALLWYTVSNNLIILSTLIGIGVGVVFGIVGTTLFGRN